MFKFKSTDDELSLDELDRVTAGVPKLGEERLLDPDELSLDELDRVTAGVPFMPDISGDLPEGVTIAENGEIIREERSR